MATITKLILTSVLIGVIYLILSLLLANQVYITLKIVIDEFFHLPQGLSYCYHEFNKWDPKITTLPGLYLLSTFICNILNSCTVSCMRFTNILASLVNIYLFIAIRKEWHPKEPNEKHVINAVNIALLPPLLFFSQVYYTDVASLTTVLGLTYFGIKGNFFLSILSSLFGFYSILMRQTNVIYVVMIAGMKTIGIFHAALFNPINYHQYDYAITLKDVYNLRKRHNWHQIRNRIRTIDILHLFEIASSVSVVILFISFVVINGGIVVGDKQAHPVTINLPQILYFTVFTLFFAWPHFIQTILPFIAVAMKNRARTILAILGIAVIINLNTIIHPYLLADNRHYTFYIWRRFFSTKFKRLCWAPIYYFSCFGIVTKIFNNADVRFSIAYIPTVVLVLGLQGLVDVRYFLTPFVLLRLYLRNVSYRILLLEFTFYVIVNVVTFYIFFTKEIVWSEFDEVQRMIW